jgi:hypothetical protein
MKNINTIGKAKELVNNSTFTYICLKYDIFPGIVQEDLQSNSISLKTLTEKKLTEFILNNY